MGAAAHMTEAFPFESLSTSFLDALESLIAAPDGQWWRDVLAHPDLILAVRRGLPELVTTRWYQFLLHNHRSTVLQTLLLLRGNRRIVVINVPWYLPE